jgi:hypothetical protein
MDLSTVNINLVNARARSTSPNQREALRKQGKYICYRSNRYWVSFCSVQFFTAATTTTAAATVLSPSPPPGPYELETDDKDTDNKGHTDSEEEFWKDRPLSF